MQFLEKIKFVLRSQTTRKKDLGENSFFVGTPPFFKQERKPQ
jgi:hypothetical protein